MRPGPNGAGLSRRAIPAEIDNSLRRLGTGHVDLYQIHCRDPPTYRTGPSGFDLRRPAGLRPVARRRRRHRA